ncbi:MAG TPA: transcription termination/antitermination NusG family protein [Chthoniobacterales bacterium]
MRYSAGSGAQVDDGYRNDWWRRAHWYAIQSTPNRETFAAANVGRLGIEIMLPRLRQRSHRRGPRIRPLFTGYFFARFVPATRLDQVRYALGVVRVVSSGQLALPVDDTIIETIKARTDDEGFFEIGAPRLRPGDRVRVEDGPFKGLLGVLERESADRTRVTIFLEALHSARVVIDSSCLAEAEAA